MPPTDQPTTTRPAHSNRIAHHRRYIAGALVMLSTVAIATDQLVLAVMAFIVGALLVASSYERTSPPTSTA